MIKTNVMRILEQNEIEYETFEYPHEDNVCVDGQEVARLLHQNPKEVFKTLVAIGKSGRFYTFVIPVEAELDLKKAARAVEEKTVELIPVKDLQKVTGYIRGGCSPIGMKKQFLTIIDQSALTNSYIFFSAGKIGYQVRVNPLDIQKAISVKFLNLVR